MAHTIDTLKLFDDLKESFTEEQAHKLSVIFKPIFEIETAWAQEVEARVAAFDRGETRADAAEDVFAEARRLIR